MDITINDARVHIEVTGTGPPLLVVHGGMGYGHASFRPWLDDLGTRRTIIYVDLPGNGGSEEPEGYAAWDSLAPLIDTLHQLREQLGHEVWSVLGHSFGGLVVQGYALAHPNEIDNLVISCSTPTMDHMDASLEEARRRAETDEQYNAVAQLLMTPRSNDEEFDAMTTLVAPVYWADPSRRPTTIADRKGGNATAFNVTLQIWPNTNHVSDLPNLRGVRTLVLGATRDWTFPPAVGPKRLHSLIENSDYYEFQDSGHFPFVEEHATFIRVVGNWLDSRPAA